MLLRPAAPEDALAVAEVHVRSWQAAYRDLLPPDPLERLRPEDRLKRYEFGSSDPSKPATIVAVEDGVIVGFTTVVPARDADARGSGEICALYVDPPWWGRKLGHALIEAGRGHLGGLGFADAVLWVLAGNLRAERFYARDGWWPDGVRRSISVLGATVGELRYRRRLSGTGPRKRL